MNEAMESEVRPFQRYAWARAVAEKVVGEIDEAVVAAIVMSVAPSPDQDVDLQIYDVKTVYSDILELRSDHRDLYDELGREDEVRQWSAGVRDVLKKKRAELAE
jgi:hypothetical protein